MRKLKVGKSAPNITLLTIDGRSAQLSDYWGNGRFALFIFTRHLA